MPEYPNDNLMPSEERKRRLARARYRKKMKIRRTISFFIITILIIAVLYFAVSTVIKNSVLAGVASSLEQSSAIDNLSSQIINDDSMPATDYSSVWSLILVNNDNPLPEGYNVETGTLDNGKEFDERAIFDLTEMLDAAAADGCPLIVCSAYRTVEYQQNLLDKKVAEYVAAGYSQQAAYDQAITIVAIPGKSEHNSGLAADIVAQDYQVLDEGFENTAQFKWLSQHAAEYGFILRYPKDKQDKTGIIYEPWHYRYVGVEYAKAIKDSGLCLEEWLTQNSN